MNTDETLPPQGDTEIKDSGINSAQISTKPLPIWRFVLPLLIQTGIILAIPAQAVYTHITGKTAILQTVPVDPYDLLRGYSVTLNYDISSLDNLKKLPGWEDLLKQYPSLNKQYPNLPQGTKLYVILQGEKPTGDGIPPAWKPIQISLKPPSSLGENQVVLEGKYKYGLISYGLETYYIPEDQRVQINEDISQAQRVKPGQRQPIVVEVKVDTQGHAVLVSMWVRDRKYRF
ncbi:MAG: GDYXXLXY domain-containing protein [Nostocaceae cyanobacterium]|nr:GDYXXLXY domain-containing protein [Nostocaceae cyanobacterium]